MSSSVRLAVVLALAALALPARAQGPLPAHAGVHVLTVGPDGGLACDLAVEAQVQGLHDASARTASQNVRLTPLPSLNAEGVSNFRIVLRATDQLLDRPAALLAFRRSAARWERILQNNVTTVIDVDFGPERFGTPYPNNVLGSTDSALQCAQNPTTCTGASDVQDFVDRLKATTSDPQLLALYDAIPVPAPSTSSEGPLKRGIGGLISLQVLGYRPPVTSPNAPSSTVPSIGFNDAFPYDFDPTDGVDADKTDFEGVAIHEIGHALGFTSAIGLSVNGQNPLFSPWDLFRVRPDAVTPGEPLNDGVGFEAAPRVVTPGPPNTEVLTVENGREYFVPVQVFFDGLEEYEVSTATGSRAGGDGQQASHWRDDALRPPSLGAARKIGIMDPNLGRGSRDELTDADIRMLDVIGYTVDFDPPTATVALSVDGQAIDDRFLITEPVDLGDVDAGATLDVPVVVGNVDAATPLQFELEAEITTLFPTTASPTLTVTVAQGTVAPGGSTTLALRVGGFDGQAIGEGVLRLKANDEDRGVIEVPVTFTVGGAVAPRLSVGTVPTSLGDLGADERRTVEIPVSNAGTFDLSYRVLTTLVTRGFEFPETSDGSRMAAPVFSQDFEGANPLRGFSFDSKAAPDRWQTRTTGPAALPGHSTPTALHYGKINGASGYSDNSLGQIRAPGIDLSGVSPDSRVTLSFAHYLQAEAGFDFATVLVSVDGGDTYEEVATSDGGVLRNTDEGWETVTVEVPGVAGFPEPVYIAFRFDSDANVTDEGWFIDDIVVDAVAGQAPFFVAPVAGVLPGNGTVTLELTADSGVLDDGFYRGSVEIRTDQPGDDPAPYPVEFTVGNPALPTVALAEAAPPVSVPGDGVGEATLRLRNGGDATLSYVRVLEPATSRFEAGATVALGRARFDGLAAPGTPGTPVADRAPARTPEARTSALPDGDVLGAIAFGTTPELYDLAQLGDGRIAVVDGRTKTSTTITVVPRDLSDPGETFSSSLGASVTGIAYDTQTESLWLVLFETAQLVEVRLEGGAIVPTGREADLDFTPFGVDYSPELDAFLIGSFETSALLTVTAEGDLLPGYPAFVDGREPEDGATSLPGVSFTQGLLETTGASDELLVRDQFGVAFGGTGGGTFSNEILAGSTGVFGMLRDRLDPNGSFFVTTRPDASSAVQSRLVRFDPPDVPAGIGTVVQALSPIFADRSIEPQEAFDVRIEVDGRDLDPGDRTDEIAFLTNNPAQPVVRIPLTLNVTAVAAEDGADGAFAFSGVDPNPVGPAGRVRFALAEAADVSVAVFDALGRRVAVLADAPMAAGAHELPFPSATLAPGVYVVRIVAGDERAARTVTVVR
ncbi:NF038122 family metalloprotease [Rubrivirga sp.]|uniref:NF038122 family metalloprotease n=1 Tax=Rubrivirga sp. TaxID=1885344 RepID=UPI003B52667D